MANYKNLIKTNRKVQWELLKSATPEAMNIKELSLWGNMLAKYLTVANRQLDNEVNVDFWRQTKASILTQLEAVTDTVANYQTAKAEGGEDCMLTVIEMAKLFELAGVCTEVWVSEDERKVSEELAKGKAVEMPVNLDLTSLEKLMAKGS